MKLILLKASVLLTRMTLSCFIVGASPLQAQEVALRNWEMKNGGTMKATGVSVNFGGVNVKSPDGSKQAFVAYDRLAPSEIKYAVENLPITLGDTEKIKFGANSISSTRDNYRIVTGYSISFPQHSTSSTSSGNSSSSSAGGIREITERESKSSKLIELKMSSITSGVAVRVDFLAIANSGGTKYVAHRKSGIFFFRRAGEVSLFDFPPMNDYHGWAFVFRSIETGQILDSVASGQHLEGYAESYIKDKGGKAEESADEIKEMLLDAVLEK